LDNSITAARQETGVVASVVIVKVPVVTDFHPVKDDTVATERELTSVSTCVRVIQIAIIALLERWVVGIDDISPKNAITTDSLMAVIQAAI